MKQARAIVDVTRGTVYATVDIAAPPERVFRALSSEEITRWWGSDDLYRTTGWSGDVKVGGRWRSSGKGADGSEFAVEGEYLAVEAPTRLVHTWQPSWETGAPTTVSYLLTPIDGGTRVVVRHEGFTDAAACQSHGDGWTRVITWLSGYASPPGKHFMVKLIPPRATFALDMSAEEALMMKAHGQYWRGKLAAGVAVAFGPVLDPAGPWGLGLIAAPDEAAVRAFEAEDPVVLAGRGFRYEIMPMLALVF